MSTGPHTGPRATATRNRLLDALAELLSTCPLRQVEITAIARIARTSPATFYQYFPCLDDALTALAQRLAEDSALAVGRGRRSGIAHTVETVLEFANDHSAVLGAVLGASLDHPDPSLAAAVDTVLDPLTTAALRAAKLSDAHSPAVRFALWQFLASAARIRTLPSVSADRRWTFELAAGQLADTLYGPDEHGGV